MSDKLIDPKVLKSLVMINSLSDDHVATLAGRVKVENFPSRTAIFKQGGRDSYTVYVLSGKVDLVADNKLVKTVTGGTDESRHPLAHKQPRRATAVTQTPVSLVRVDSNVLDTMVTWDQSSNLMVEEIGAEESNGDMDWMTQILQTKAFHKIPAANIQAMFIRMEEVSYRAGDVIIRQGDPGDFYYIIKSGKCGVLRSTKKHPKGMKLAELKVGDSFGEDALISDSKRNASVVMMTEGRLMRLSKADFIKLLNEPLIEKISFSEANELVTEKGAIWLDVRLPNEYKNSHIGSSINLPFYLLRMKIDSLSDDKTYIAYCDTGSRSSAVAYLLNERGYEAKVLDGGLVKAPQDACVGG